MTFTPLLLSSRLRVSLGSPTSSSRVKNFVSSIESIYKRRISFQQQVAKRSFDAFLNNVRKALCGFMVVVSLTMTTGTARGVRGGGGGTRYIDTGKGRSYSSFMSIQVSNYVPLCTILDTFS